MFYSLSCKPTEMHTFKHLNLHHFPRLDPNKYQSLALGKFGSTIYEWSLLFHKCDDGSALRCLVVLRIQIVKYKRIYVLNPRLASWVSGLITF